MEFLKDPVKHFKTMEANKKKTVVKKNMFEASTKTSDEQNALASEQSMGGAKEDTYSFIKVTARDKEIIAQHEKAMRKLRTISPTSSCDADS